MSASIMRRAVAVAAAVVCTVSVTSALGAAKPGCTERMSGGEWATYGQNLMGQQRQDAERTISKETVSRLAPVWKMEEVSAQSAPPIVAGGCVFLNTNGNIEARSLRTGALVWRSEGADTSGTFAPTVVNGRVHIGLTAGSEPRAAAFDQRTGKLLWLSDAITFGQPANQLSSAIVYRGIQVLFTTGPDNEPEAKQGYGLIDAATGRVIYKSLTLPKADRDKGLVGGGAWGTPTVDPKTGYAYVGTSNPESKQGESDYDNAILKLDLNRSRKTFGRIVATYKGTPDSVTGYDNPVCQTVGGQAYYNAGMYGSSPTCGQIDVDFGVGPTLWRDAKGRLLGAATQKSGFLHVFDAGTMKPVWTKQLFVTLSFVGGNIGRIATDGKTLYVVANPGVLYALDAATGATRWQLPLGGVTPKGGNVVLANGIVYYVDDFRARGYDAANGSVLWESPVVPGSSIGSAAAVAGNHFVANHYGVVTVYRLQDG